MKIQDIDPMQVSIRKSVGSLMSTEQIEKARQIIASSNTDIEFAYAHLRKLCEESFRLQKAMNLMGKNGSTPENREFKIIQFIYSRRTIYIKRIIKQIARKWWAARGEAANKKLYKPKDLRVKLFGYVGGIIPETELINMLWQERMRNERLSQKSFTLSTLREMLKNGENNTLELKSSLSLTDAIAKTVCAFSNTAGGRIVVGIRENTKADTAADAPKILNIYSVVGIEGDVDISRQKLTMFLGEKINLPIESLKIYLEQFKDRTIMIIDVPKPNKSTLDLVFYNKEAYIREDNHNRSLKGLEIYNLVKQRLSE